MKVDLGNITARIAFKCAKKNFSETIIGESGAENLTGQGDMYFKSPTITFRPSAWEEAIIEQRVTLSGMRKKDFIVRSCIYSNIVVVGKKENVQRIVDALQEMQIVMKEIAGQIQSGNFSLTDNSYQELKNDYLAFAATLMDIMNGAAYLFEK